MDGPLSGRRVAGYELREVIGRGATATVYRARQLRLGRDVAIKVLDPAFGDQPEYVEPPECDVDGKEAWLESFTYLDPFELVFQ